MTTLAKLRKVAVAGGSGSSLSILSTHDCLSPTAEVAFLELALLPYFLFSFYCFSPVDLILWGSVEYEHSSERRYDMSLISAIRRILLAR